jgi:Flp pilus assembly protein TadD
VRQAKEGEVPMMDDSEAMKEFKEGMNLLRNDYAMKALPHFCKAAELDKRNPFYRSYMGLALAEATGKFSDAEQICLAVLRTNRTRPELYLNLAQVYHLAGQKEDAVDTLTDGLRFTKQDHRLLTALRKLGVRRPAVLPFLERTHSVNRKLGKLRHRVLKSFGKEA